MYPHFYQKPGYLNDLWIFDVTSGWWTWLSGAKTVNQAGNYGTKGVSSASSQPGARSYHSMAIDPSGTYIYVFGGMLSITGTLTMRFMIYLTINSIGRLNDLWMFDLTSGWWVWSSGAKIANQVAFYGEIGKASFGNRPGARYGHSMVMDHSGKLLCVFGGRGYDMSGEGNLSLKTHGVCSTYKNKVCSMIYGFTISRWGGGLGEAVQILSISWL